MEPLRQGDLAIDVSRAADGAARLIWRGKSNARDPGSFLRPFLSDVIDEAGTSKQAVRMHFEGLEHFNSSTITALVHLIQNARQREIALTFFFDAERKWQKTSFDALRAFERADGLLQIKGMTASTNTASDEEPSQQDG